MKKIVTIGPESTGKSTLCKLLAEHYKTTWVPEYAREYLLENGKDYQYNDLLKIAEGQIALEEKICDEIEANNNSSLVIIDTDLLVIKVWSEFVFNKCDNSILTQIANRKYDLYILCKPDLPWVKDELREYPDVETRNKLYNHYKDILVNQQVPWVEVSGNYEERSILAFEAINRIL
ncbi:MAG: ATP-binding protein [Bacteroidetes bacterium]|nr:ATP-binding protein [Bacteroidota bacterium]